FEGTAYFKFPFFIRWNFTMRPAGVALSSGEEAFDGEVCRKRHNREPITVVSDAEQDAPAQARVWTGVPMLATPLPEQYVELKTAGERNLIAFNTDFKIMTRLNLNEDHTLDSTTTNCLHPTSGKRQNFLLQLSEGQQLVGGLMLPRKITTCWDGEAEF